MVTTYYDYKPIPKYKVGDMVFRVWAGLWMHHPEPIGRVFVKRRLEDGKWYIEYYFKRERTPYDESNIYATLEDIINAELKHKMESAMNDVLFLKKIAEKHNLNLRIQPTIEYKEENK